MKESSKINAILVDFDASETWSFRRAVEETTGETWMLYKGISNRNHGNGMQKLVRYVKYFALPFKIFLTRGKFTQVLAWQQFYGLILAFYFRIFHVKNAPEITVMTFIYKPKSKPVIGGIYDKFMRYIVTSKYIRRFIVFSESEREHYSRLFGVSQEKFLTLKLAIEDVKDNFQKEQTDEKYLLAAGRSNRDYSFLIDAWKEIGKTGGYCLEIVCDTLHERNTEFITYLDHCHGDEYLKELSNCYAVILPLKDKDISSGQLVLLQAMMFGKPIIVTQNDTVSDYVRDGFNGLIIEKSKDALFEAVDRLQEEEFYGMLSQNARNCFENNFDIFSLGTQVGKILKNI